jgi:hypothetical protein
VGLTEEAVRHLVALVRSGCDRRSTNLGTYSLR